MYTAENLVNSVADIISVNIELALWYTLFFFFKQKTAYEVRISDWSSDVCSSDLAGNAGDIHGEAVLRIVSILLLPFVAGQLVQRWLRPWVLAHRGLAIFMDRSAIAIAVYVAFSAAVVGGIWGLLDAREIVIVLAAVAVLLALRSEEHTSELQ